MSRGTLMGLLTRGSGGKTPAASLGAQSTHPKAAAPDPGPVSRWAHVGPRGIVWSVLRLCQAFGPLGFPEKMQLCPHPHPRPQGAPRGGCAPCALWPGVGVCLGEGTQEGLRTERAGKENDRLTSGAVVSRGGRAWPDAFARLARVWPQVGGEASGQQDAPAQSPARPCTCPAGRLARWEAPEPSSPPRLGPASGPICLVSPDLPRDLQLQLPGGLCYSPSVHP